MKVSFRALAVLALCLMGCGSTQDEDPASRSSMEGCRSPEEPGCALCTYSIEGVCIQKHGSGTDHNGTSYYSSSDRYEGSCSAFPSCAQCSLEDESNLRALTPRAECDCTKESGVDPCFYRESCGCYCEALKTLSAACPEVPQGVPAP